MTQFGTSPASNDSVALAIAGDPGYASVNAVGNLAETIPAYAATTAVTPATGDLYIWPVSLAAGQSVGHVGYVTSTVAGASLTHSSAYLIDNNYVVQAVSADNTGSTMTASKYQVVAMATAYVTTYTGRYFVGVMIANSSGTQPTLCGTSAGPLIAMMTGTGAPVPVYGGQSNTGVSTPLALGTVVTTPTATIGVPYMFVTN